MAFSACQLMALLASILLLHSSGFSVGAGMLEDPAPPPLSQHSSCIDYRNQTIAHGESYVPHRSDMCMSCVCHDGHFDKCQSGLCAPPKPNCVALDDECCKFNCDRDNITDAEPKDTDTLNTTNLGLRLVASTVTSFLILALLLFMIHRLRQRRLLLMIRRINGSQMSGGPYGPRRFSVDEDGSVGYLTGQDQVDFGTYDEPPPPYTFWKPPEAYFTHEEAPPPYEASPAPVVPPSVQPQPPQQQLRHQQYNNDRNRDNNAANLGHHHHHPHPHPHGAVPPASVMTPPYSAGMAGAVFPIHCSQRPGAFGAPPLQLQHPPVSHPVYANSPMLPSVGGIIPSLTQVSLRTNNFQMNNLDQESCEPNGRRHSVSLNVVGSSPSSLNSSQSGELNESLAENTTAALRSDAVYVGRSAGMIPPLVPTTTSTSATTTSRPSRPNSEVVTAVAHSRSAPRERPVSAVVVGGEGDGGSARSSEPAPAAKCRSCSDVGDCWHNRADDRRHWRRNTAKQLQYHRPTSQPRYYMDSDCGSSTVAWLADGSGSSSSSSSPTYERATLSPTSSDSSSIDYNYGQRSDAPNEPRHVHSETQFAAAPAPAATQADPSVAVSGPSRCVVGRKSGSASSLDRTLDALRAKMSLKRKTVAPPPAKDSSKLRHLLANLGNNGGASAESVVDRSDAALQGDSGDRRRFSTSDAGASIESRPLATVTDACTSKPVASIVSQRPRSLHHYQRQRGDDDEQFHRATRISYVNDGEVASRATSEKDKATKDEPPTVVRRPRVLQLERRGGQPRPRSYDFADLSGRRGSGCDGQPNPVVATCGSIAEESSGAATRGSDDPSSLAEATAAGSLCSLDGSFACTCSSRASFGSSGSVSREGPATPGSSDCSPAVPSTPDALPAFPPPCRPPLSVMARSGSVCSETGERRHSHFHHPPLRMVQPAPPAAQHCGDHPVRIESATVMPLATASSAAAVSRCPRHVEEPAAEAPTVSGARSCGTEAADRSDREGGGGPGVAVAANRIRVSVGTWGTNESFI